MASPLKTAAAGLGRRGDDVGYGSKTRQRQPFAACLKDGFMTGHLIVADEGSMRVIKLRRPEKKNAITLDMYRGMSDAIDTAQNNPAIRCLIITGGSGVVTAGNDGDDFLKDATGHADTPPPSNMANFLYSLAHNVKPIVALPAEAAATPRKLRRLPPEDLPRRIDQEGHLFSERMRAQEGVAAFKEYVSRRHKV